MALPIVPLRPLNSARVPGRCVRNARGQRKGCRGVSAKIGTGDDQVERVVGEERVQAEVRARRYDLLSATSIAKAQERRTRCPIHEDPLHLLPHLERPRQLTPFSLPPILASRVVIHPCRSLRNQVALPDPYPFHQLLPLAREREARTTTSETKAPRRGPPTRAARLVHVRKGRRKGSCRREGRRRS